MRGADRIGGCRAAGEGVIPAGAGSRQRRSTRCWPSRGHPRGCGEQCSPPLRHQMRRGSSPRVRGAARSPAQVPEHLGVIPAGAGSSYDRGEFDGLGRGHPRGCGEQFPAGVQTEVMDGVIPAGAGSSPGLAFHSGRGRGHPRGCGEQRSGQRATSDLRGSSPRVRGAGHRNDSRLGRLGVIPAGAGSSRALSWSSPSAGGHPRGCGEQSS
ncbi:conserved hypothetical protein [Streptomyces sp. Mg1]|nr:conserved hypothetical protein [Streptomyces sp. Mg1]